jgi:hypothetical protein
MQKCGKEMIDNNIDCENIVHYHYYAYVVVQTATYMIDASIFLKILLNIFPSRVYILISFNLFIFHSFSMVFY